jgi:hypothetical protein
MPLLISFAALQLLEAGHRDLVARQPQIAPLRAAIDSLLQGSNLDIATRGDAIQRQCDEMIHKLATTKSQVQPSDAPSAECLVGLFLSSAILQLSHAADLCRFFKGISLVSQHLVHAAKHRSDLLGAWLHSHLCIGDCVALCR